MITLQNKKDCCGCNACVQKCPHQCIAMTQDNEGFWYPQVDIASCINCGVCEKVCPVIHPQPARTPIEVFAAINPDTTIRKQSSSGGIFTMLANHIIVQGGVVFGAGFDTHWNVEHQYTETANGLSAFRGSKYVQSRIGSTFKQAETFLKQGRLVLFSGTPCQIAGLKLFLQKDYTNLLTIDFICHGVPSPGVWQTYLTENIRHLSKRRHLLSIQHISFRDKTQGWKKYGLAIQIASTPTETATCNSDRLNTCHQHTFYESLHKNPFLKGFLADLYLRPSCHACPAKMLKSGSDITLADYWRIHELLPDLDDDQGVSAILINTEKGKLYFDSLNVHKYPTHYEDICLRNKALCHSSPLSAKRESFFSDSSRTTFVHKVNRLLRPPLRQQIRIKISAIIHAIIS